jgi:hypothetical protein
VADPISTLPDGSPLTDAYKVPFTEVTTDQNGQPFADVVTWAVDDTTDFSLADVTDTTCTLVPGTFTDGTQVTATVTASDAAGLSASQVVIFTGTFVAVAMTLEITAGTPEPK